MNYKLSEELLKETIEYLETKPHNWVKSLIVALNEGSGELHKDLFVALDRFLGEMPHKEVSGLVQRISVHFVQWTKSQQSQNAVTSNEEKKA